MAGLLGRAASETTRAGDEPAVVADLPAELLDFAWTRVLVKGIEHLLARLDPLEDGPASPDARLRITRAFQARALPG